MNQRIPTRALSLDGLRGFEAVARRLSFSAAADELFLTQSAISRQIKALEAELGAPLFTRGTRKVELTSAGELLRQAVLPALERIDRTVRQIRTAQGRRQVNLTTFASFATLWLLPRLAAFQQQHPDIDIRISASDHLAELDAPELDLALRYDFADRVPPPAQPLFGEWLSPVASPALMWQAQNGHAPALATPADLAQHTLLEEDGHKPGSAAISWRHWLQQAGLATLAPRRWIYLNYTHQHVQGALAGQGVALARLSLVHDLLQRGELVEPFGRAGRLAGPASYWLIPLSTQGRPGPDLQAFTDWVHAEAAATRAALADPSDPTNPTDAPRASL